MCAACPKLSGGWVSGWCCLLLNTGPVIRATWIATPVGGSVPLSKPGMHRPEPWFGLANEASCDELKSAPKKLIWKHCPPLRN
jgi:hypothetical protein